MEEFKLKDSFIDKYKKIKPPFGFNGLGEIAYLRSYSRMKEDGTKEQWYETIRRVVEGTYSIQKDHIMKYNLGWSDRKAQRSAEEMYDRMFHMKFLPPGRGLWAMGSPLVMERGVFAALNNCSFVSTENITEDLTKPFEFMMEMSMVGVGVGFDVLGADKLKVQKPISDAFNYPIADSREGWIVSVKMVLQAYFEGKVLPNFDYSLIRPAGRPIKSFGGESAGPKPLMELHENIRNLLDERIGKKLTATDITDLMNFIGVCVVAGNIRRTSQIAFGSYDNIEFRKLKDYKWNAETSEWEGPNAKRAGYGWTSNNSIHAKVGMDYSDVAAQTGENGEPGYAWLENMRSYGRMKDKANGKDTRVVGSNPCMEQSLESYEMCCLVETFPERAESKKDFLRTLKFAYLYAKTVTLGKTNWVETNRVQLRNRRIGTSVSGIAQFIANKGIDELKTWLEEGYQTIKQYDDTYSEWLAIPKSIKVTSVKPSGTVSLLPGATPGVHYPESNFYIRRIRFNKDSDMIEPLKKAGYHIEPDVTAPDKTLVVGIPVSIGGVRVLKEVSMWEQLELAAFMQHYWADNQVSCTVTFQEHEKQDIEKALNFYQYRLKGISFLPKTEKGLYAQMPYEEITEEKYQELLKPIKPLKISKMEDSMELEKFCDGDTCLV
jgi:adenosylcobalamin-dependent ribonucleoside-triphosphate reductase